MNDQPSDWHPWPREWGRYKVVRRMWSNFAGSAYEYARDDYGFVRRFWTLRGAQACADKLNTK